MLRNSDVIDNKDHKSSVDLLPTQHRAMCVQASCHFIRVSRPVRRTGGLSTRGNWGNGKVKALSRLFHTGREKQSSLKKPLDRFPKQPTLSLVMGQW